MAPQEPRWSQVFSEPTRTHLWRIALGLLVLVALYGIARVTLHVVLDAEFVEDRINAALASTTDTTYQASIGDVQWGLLHPSVRAEQITVHPDSPRFVSPQGTNSGVRVRATLPELRIQGIHLWALLWNRDVRLHTVTLRHPHVRLIATGAADTAKADTRRTESFDRSDISVHAALARSLPEGEVQRLDVEEGTLSVSHRSNPPRPADSLWGLSLRLRDLVLDSTAAQDPSRVLFSDRITLTIDGFRHLSSDSLYALTLGPSELSTQDSSLTIEAPRLTPTVSDEAFMRRHKYRANRFKTTARQITMDGLEFRPFIEERAVLAEALHLDSLVVDVYRNNHLPPHPQAPLPKTMPHEAVRRLDRALRIDTIRVTDGYTAYTKLHEDASEPGTITFENLWASIYNVTNDPQRMSPETPAVVDARTRVAGAGLLRATIRLPLLSPHLNFSYEGQLGPMDAQAFNPTFANLSGIRIESGQIDSLWFEANIQKGTASGTVQGIYRNLEVEIVDLASREQELPDRIKTFVVNDLALRHKSTRQNPPLRTGQISHQHQKGDTFFKFLWHSLRSGLYSLVGL